MSASSLSVSLSATLAAAVIAVLVLGGALWPRLPPWAGAAGRAGDDAAVAGFTAEERDRAATFHRVRRPLAYGRLALRLAVVLALGLTPAGGEVVGAVADRAGWATGIVAAVVLLALVPELLALPLAIAGERHLRAVGLSTRSWRSYAADLAKGEALGTVLLCGVLLGAYAVMRALPGNWWLPVGAAGALLAVVFSFVFPLVVEPLFSRFTPLEEGPLRKRMLELAHLGGVRVRQVLVSDASRRTTALNAYVSGLGASRRIVVFDTALDEPDGVALIAAHELGHARANDVSRMTLLGAVGVFAGTCALAAALAWPALREAAGAGVGAGDPRSVPLALALGEVAGVALAPVTNAMSRAAETRADLFALALTRDPGGIAELFRRLSRANRTDLAPSALSRHLFGTHPAPPGRIATVLAWPEHAEPHSHAE